jgi:DNA transformation protein and related proteins
MKTKQSTVDYILEQTASAGKVSARKMFGEYALYCDKKVVALICRDTLFVKITDQGKAFAGKKYREGRAYIGAKKSMVIGDDQIEDHKWLSELIHITAINLPTPKPKVPTAVKQPYNSPLPVRPWFIYIARCADNTLYTGISTNVTQRIMNHNSKKGASYTKSRGPVELILTEGPLTESAARKCEAAIKKLTREEKEAFIKHRLDINQ